jgi:hypothetical protein
MDCGPPMVWPSPFKRLLTKKEGYIQKLDVSAGVSLKFTMLNPEGKRQWSVWASVIYADAHGPGFAHKLATESQTYEYTKTFRAWIHFFCYRKNVCLIGQQSN